MKTLTPGDFALVKGNAEIMGITDAAELVKMLADEIKYKKIEKQLGFAGR